MKTKPENPLHGPVTYDDVLDAMSHLLKWERCIVYPANTLVIPFADTRERMEISIDDEEPEMWLTVEPPGKDQPKWMAWVEKDGVVCRLPASDDGFLGITCDAQGDSRAEVIHSVLWALVAYLGSGGHSSFVPDSSPGE